MNDEIKYWLEGLDELSYEKILNYITNLQQDMKNYVDIVLYQRKTIDNLQQENERLKEILVWKQEHEKELHTRIDKAIEYIDEMCKFGDKYACYGDDLHPEYIIKILQGEDNE